MAELINEFSVSKSKIENFNTCLRKYYYRHYGHWNGWKRNAPEHTREIYALSKLHSRPTWLGTEVHNFIDLLICDLRNGKSVNDWTKIEQRLRLRMEHSWQRSAHIFTDGEFYTNPKKAAETSACLLEHFYEMTNWVQQEHFEQDFSQAIRCVKGFLTSSVFNHLVERPDIRIISIEDFSSTLIAGTKTFVQIDLALLLPNKTMRLVDWKTGYNTNRRSVLNQLLVYGVYAVNELRAPVEAVELYGVDLLNGIDHTMAFSEYWYWAVHENIKTVSSQLKTYLTDPETNLAEIDRFPKTKSTSKCIRCPFKKPCGR